MPTYRNGYIPDDLLVTFATGWSQTDGEWKHQLSAATYAKHRALVKRSPGGRLSVTPGWGAYRPYAAQVTAQRLYGNGAATPGTSSHGGFWEGRQTLAIDYHNWGSVYGWDQGRFFADVRAVGLTPGMIMRSRGYPDEPWHVIDLDPWGAVPAGIDATPWEGDMPLNDDDLQKISDKVAATVRDWIRFNVPGRDVTTFDTFVRDTYVSLGSIATALKNVPGADLSGIPEAVWSYELKHSVDSVPVPAGDFLRYEPKQHEQTRAAIVGLRESGEVSLEEFSDEDMQRIAAAVADEQDRRARERLNG